MISKGKGGPPKKKAKASSKSNKKMGVASFFSLASRDTQQNSTNNKKKDPPTTIIGQENPSKLAAPTCSHAAKAPDATAEKQISTDADLAAFFKAHYPPSSFKHPKPTQYGANRSCKK